jgi:hypothetical protein
VFGGTKKGGGASVACDVWVGRRANGLFRVRPLISIVDKFESGRRGGGLAECHVFGVCWLLPYRAGANLCGRGVVAASIAAEKVSAGAASFHPKNCSAVDTTRNVRRTIADRPWRGRDKQGPGIYAACAAANASSLAFQEFPSMQRR